MAVAIAAASVAATASSDFVTSTKKSLSQYSVAALALLGELLAPMLDIIYSSDEKEKVRIKYTRDFPNLDISRHKIWIFHYHFDYIFTGVATFIQSYAKCGAVPSKSF